MSTTENSLPSDDMPVTPNSEPLQTDPVLKVPPRHQASTGETPGTPEGSNEAPHSTISPRQARQRLNVPMPNMEVLAIDDALGIQTEIDKARDKFLDLVESLKTGRYLTDRIQGVEKHSGQGEPRAVIFHGDYKVIIMASMIVDLPKDLRGQDPYEVYHYLLTKRLGSEIDYVVKGIDRNTGLAVGSRKDAMATKRRHYYLNQTRDGTYRIYEGLCCEDCLGKYHLCHHSQITLKEGILMTQCELSKEELVRRKELSDNTRKMIYSLLDVAAEDETSLMTTYRDFYLQISFSELHPLMVFYLARPLDGEKAMLADRSNEMNLRSVLGSHSVNENFSCYNYRATHWLDAQMTKTRFFEILDRCVDEAVRGYYQLAH